MRKKGKIADDTAEPCNKKKKRKNHHKERVNSFFYSVCLYVCLADYN